MSWKFDDKHTAAIYDSQGREWRLEVKPDSFATFFWVAKPVRHTVWATMYGGPAIWSDRAEAKAGAEATLSELGFTQPAAPRGHGG